MQGFLSKQVYKKYSCDFESFFIRSIGPGWLCGITFKNIPVWSLSMRSYVSLTLICPTLKPLSPMSFPLFDRPASVSDSASVSSLLHCEKHYHLHRLNWHHYSYYCEPFCNWMIVRCLFLFSVTSLWSNKVCKLH